LNGETSRFLPAVPLLYSMWDYIEGGRITGAKGRFAHIPGGVNALYLDGHVEFVRYPGEFPASPGNAAVGRGF